MNLKKSKINGYYHPKDPGEPGTGEKRLSVSDLEAQFLAEFAYLKIVLEIGTGLGVATRTMAKTASQVHTVDVDPWVAGTVELPDNVVFHRSLEVLSESLSQANFFDMAFVDGSHATEDVIRDIGFCKKAVKPHGLILFHDINMDSVIDGIVESGLTVYELKFGAGIGLAWND